MPTNSTKQIDPVVEARALLTKCAPSGKITNGADAYLFDMRGPMLLKTLADEVERLRKVAEFAVHTTDCKWRLHIPRTDCTCGLTGLLENDND